MKMEFQRGVGENPTRYRIFDASLSRAISTCRCQPLFTLLLLRASARERNTGDTMFRYPPITAEAFLIIMKNYAERRVSDQEEPITFYHLNLH